MNLVQLLLLDLKRSLEKDLSLCRSAGPSNTPGKFVQGDGQLQIVRLQPFFPDMKSISANFFRLPGATRLFFVVFKRCWETCGLFRWVHTDVYQELRECALSDHKVDLAMQLSRMLNHSSSIEGLKTAPQNDMAC